MIDHRDRIVTVLGGGGFIGRYVCEALFKAAVRVRIGQRDPRRAWYIQPLGGVGQLAVTSCDLTRPETLAAAVDGAFAVINLVGTFDERSLRATHVAGAEAAAEAAARAKAEAFVHISAIGADPASPGEYGRTKAEGEAAVRAAFANATIIRPSVVFGPEDQFTNRFAGMARLPVLPVIAPATRFQPVYVRDLAQAIAAAALDPRRHGGRTYEIAGPEVMTMRELNETVAAMAGKAPDIVQMPDLAAEALSYLGFLPGAPLTRDQWKMLGRDNVAEPGMPGLEAFGITPTPLAAVAPDWLGRFRKGGRFGPRVSAEAS